MFLALCLSRRLSLSVIVSGLYYRWQNWRGSRTDSRTKPPRTKPSGQNPLDKTPRTKPSGQKPPDKTPPTQNPPDKAPRTIPPWTKPPDGQNPPWTKPP